MEPSQFKELKEQFLLDIKAVIEMENVPCDLILIGTTQASSQVQHGQWKLRGQRGLQQ